MLHLAYASRERQQTAAARHHSSSQRVNSRLKSTPRPLLLCINSQPCSGLSLSHVLPDNKFPFIDLSLGLILVGLSSGLVKMFAQISHCSRSKSGGSPAVTKAELLVGVRPLKWFGEVPYIVWERPIYFSGCMFSTSHNGKGFLSVTNFFFSKMVFPSC